MKGPARLCREIFFDFLEELDIPYIFGNPGTTELPLLDGCTDRSSVSYVLSLHEDVAVAQATGYARASGKIGIVNLHVAPGVAMVSATCTTPTAPGCRCWSRRASITPGSRSTTRS